MNKTLNITLITFRLKSENYLGYFYMLDRRCKFPECLLITIIFSLAIYYNLLFLQEID